MNFPYELVRRASFVGLDQFKAFDLVEHDYLFAALRALDFPQSSVDLLSELYTGLSSAFTINSFFVFRHSGNARGVRQGCPSSVTFFVLSLDPLLRRVQSCPGVHGFPLPGTGVVALSAYADDLSLLVRYEDSITAFTRAFTIYCALSVARLS